MPVLSALAVLAFAALIGAAIAIIVAVRRSRRRREQRASDAAHQASAQPITSAVPPPIPGPPHLRNFPTRLGKHPAAAASAPGQTEWNPFGTAETNFADLSDPTPGGRRLKPPPGRAKRTDRTD